MKKILEKILQIQLSHPWAVLLTALALSLLSVFYTAGNLGFLTGQMDLISSDDRLAKLAGEVSVASDVDSFIVVIENRDTARSLAFLHALVPILEHDTTHFGEVFYRVDPERFKPWALLYMNKGELADLAGKLRRHEPLIRTLTASPSLSTLFAAINQEMTSSMMGELLTGFLDTPLPKNQEEPLDLSFLIGMLSTLEHYLGNNGHYVSPWSSFFAGGFGHENADETGYFWTEHKRFLLFFVTSKTTDEGFADKLAALNNLRGAIARLQQTFPDIQAGVTGQEALNQDEMSTAFDDISLATILSLVGLALLLIVVWRGIRYPLLELITLLVALTVTFGCTTLFIGHLNILSVTFAPLLLGLGIDYGIHWLARYQEKRRLSGQSSAVAIRETMLQLGPSILLAGVTAAISFFPLTLTGFKGLVELGEIASMGMVITVVITICLLPALLTIFDKRPIPQKKAAGNSASSLLRFTRGRARVHPHRGSADRGALD